MTLVTPETVRLREAASGPTGPRAERYRIPAQGSIVIELHPDDRLTLVDPEGGQPGELLVFDQHGKPSPGALGVEANAGSDGIRSILGSGPREESASLVVSRLTRRGIDPGSARAHRFFGAGSPPGARTTLTAQCQCTCLIAAPGRNMPVDGQNPPTDLQARVQRSETTIADDGWLPDPLADPRLELRVPAANARSYLVRKGEYIQIIDVAGRECSDFQAFDQRQLDLGVERPLDITTTRTFMGAAYPGPGLHAKYMNVDQRPLVEVVRDTVGRHDTFGLACTAKYYEDQGYFGHPNCSDNFSDQLEQYGIARRKGWEAVNFFYNTAIDANNAIYLDEPWSRPGDYVLLKALDDLVCVSSACPDDISAANAWNPTDIHVRVYPSEEKFSRAIAFRAKADADMKLTKETGFHPCTSELTRSFVEYRGYWLPSHYHNYGKEKEYYACRERVAMIDLSPLRKFEVVGQDAEALLNWTATRNVKKLAQGQVAYTAMCYEHGGMFDDGTIFRLGDNNFRWIGGDEFGGEWLREQARLQGLGRVSVKSSSDQIHNVSVQGPRSRELLEQIVWTPPAQPSIDELGWFRFTIGRLHELDGVPLLVSRTGYTGELGFEVWCHPDDAPAVWNAVWDAGKPYGISPLGLDALDMLRIEAGLIFYGQEFCSETDPFEAGIGFTVALKTKQEDYLGKEALARRKAHPIRKLVGLELQGNEPAAAGDCVHAGHGEIGGRAQVGAVTSATRSPVLNKNIALCRIDVTHAEPGTPVEVGKLDGEQKRIPATVARIPFYDPEKKRVRS